MKVSKKDDEDHMQKEKGAKKLEKQQRLHIRLPVPEISFQIFTDGQ